MSVDENNIMYLLIGRIRKEYEVIADKALTTPTDTQQLMELKEFVEKAEEKDLIELEDRMALAWHRSGTKCAKYVWCDLHVHLKFVAGLYL